MDSSESKRPNLKGPDQRLRPVERIQRQIEFREVFKSGRCFRDPILRIHFLRNRRECSRLGLVVSRKMGRAVTRNRLKRVLRVIFRKAKAEFPVSLDVVLVPNPSAGLQRIASYTGVMDRFLAWYRSENSGSKDGGKS